MLTNAYWVVLGIWWCKLRHLDCFSFACQAEDEGRSYIPTTPPWSPTSYGRKSFYHWLETGNCVLVCLNQTLLVFKDLASGQAI
jgi:hypothetical protein